MRRDPRGFLWDARAATDAIVAFTRGRSFDDYAGDLMFRSAAERQFEIIGEAVNQRSLADPARSGGPFRDGYGPYAATVTTLGNHPETGNR